MTPPVVVPIRPLAKTVDSLERLWLRFDAARASFSDELAATPIGFVAWVSQAHGFEIGDPADPVGVFLFTGVEEGEQAWAHPFIWERDRYPPAALIEAARTACRAMFTAFRLVRINGLTPVTNLPARVFAERVGFVVEGRLRQAVSMGGLRTDAWLSGLLPADLAALVAPVAAPDAAAPHETMEGGEEVSA